MAKCVAFKRQNGKYSILAKETRKDKHGRELSLFTLKKREADEPVWDNEQCTVVEPYKASKSVIGNWEGKRLFEYTRKVAYGDLTRMPSRILHKIMFS
jgi:hypothetical protein